jgi:hypothetical protein
LEFFFSLTMPTRDLLSRLAPVFEDGLLQFGGFVESLPVFGPLFFFLPTSNVRGAAADIDDRDGNESSYVALSLKFDPAFLPSVAQSAEQLKAGDAAAADNSRWGRHASRIAFKITMDACSRLGQRRALFDALSPCVLAEAPPDNQTISASARASDSTADVTAASD